jgi:hypothetical protein
MMHWAYRLTDEHQMIVYLFTKHGLTWDRP